MRKNEIEKDTSEEKGIPAEELLLCGKKRAMQLLERRDYSRKELTEKLRKDGYAEELLTEIIAYLDSYHYLDDVRYAGMLIRGRKTTKSRRELVYYLKTKGISDEDIEAAMEADYHMKDEGLNCFPYGEGGSDEEEVTGEEQESPEFTAIRRQLNKYHVTKETFPNLTYEEKQKLAARLYRKGYSQENIRRELDM
ncbi:MAG: regulatory protein RecX [Lachnospiraceae bacterium]